MQKNIVLWMKTFVAALFDWALALKSLGGKDLHEVELVLPLVK
jgi:hypothetical protein